MGGGGGEGTLLVLHLVNRPEQIICSYLYMYQSALRSLARLGRCKAFTGDEWQKDCIWD